MVKKYPAIFHAEKGGVFWVEFPDFKGCFTQGETLDEAYEMAKEALLLWLAELKEFPTPSTVFDLSAEVGAKIMLVEVELGQ
ncbi:MAG: type II toxin-antitoxin system HicB family antitoxin [Clostridia bacterium]|nr:type II toxin-antitoxin system HicB family antitoxin [Clostridia bacterium]